MGRLLGALDDYRIASGASLERSITDHTVAALRSANGCPHTRGTRCRRIDLHYWTTPNGHKITMFLEETGLPYRIVPVNIGKGRIAA